MIKRLLIVIALLIFAKQAFAINITYEGAFSLPKTDDSLGRWGYGGESIAFNPNGDLQSNDSYPGSLFGTGHVHENMVSEVRIPNAKKEKLHTARTITNFTDVTKGIEKHKKLNRFGGLAIINNTLYWSLYQYYSVEPLHEIDFATFGMSNLKLGNSSGLYNAGKYGIDNYHQKKTSRYMAPIPDAWTETPGKLLAVGKGDGPGLKKNSYGPSIIAVGVEPENGTLPAEVLVMYTEEHKLPGWSACDKWSGLAWFNEAVVVVGRKGLGKECYGTGEACKDPEDSSKGYHCYPYEAQFLLYSPKDIAMSARGEKEPYEVLPFDIYKPDFKKPGGAAADIENNVLYVVEQKGENVRVHVYKVNSSQEYP